MEVSCATFDSADIPCSGCKVERIMALALVNFAVQSSSQEDIHYCFRNLDRSRTQTSSIFPRFLDSDGREQI